MQSHPDTTGVRWAKSSYSGASGNCVEVADLDNLTAVRDSKNPAAGHLAVPRGRWSEFLAGVSRNDAATI